MVVTIYYWKFGGGNVGHLSMKLSDGTYISHWPEESAKPLSSPIRGEPNPSLAVDIRAEGKHPDETLSLPDGMVDENLIRTWWRDQVKQGTRYQLLFANCAQMVRAGLIKGGITRYEPGSFDTNHNPTVTPFEILYWIKECINYYQSARNPLHSYLEGWFK